MPLQSAEVDNAAKQRNDEDLFGQIIDTVINCDKCQHLYDGALERFLKVGAGSKYQL